MNLNTNLSGRLRNTNLPKSHALFPLFEAVVNSIHSIDDYYHEDISKAYIQIEIVRDGQQDLINEETNGQLPDIIGFKIADNGIGFNDENYISFQTLDSEHKIEKGCRGIGRLLWLKAFDNVHITSCYDEGAIKKIRSFDFNATNDIENDSVREPMSSELHETCVELLNLKKKYISSVPKNAETIGKALLEHCLWYFLRDGGAPKITILDDDTIELDDVYDKYMLSSSDQISFTLKNREFNLIHVKLRTGSSSKNQLVYCAENRVVKEESLKDKISGLFGAMHDGQTEFCYLGFLTSKFLDETVKPERTGFNISDESNTISLFDGQEISFKDIRDEVGNKISDYLEEYLSANKLAGKEKIHSFVAEKAPKYKPLLKRIPEEQQIVDPKISDKDLDLKLHKELANIERQMLSEGHDLIESSAQDNFEEYETKLKEYLSKASDIKRSDLANYVSHRKVVIELLKKAIQRQDDGKYVKEDYIHQLIMPMRKESDELIFEDSNLWLIDERLAFHNYFASDKTLNSMSITDSDSTKEPDLIGLNVFDNPLLVNEGDTIPLASITVIEIKRPMRNDASAGEEKDPVEQALGYLKRVRNGNVKTPTGRPIPNSNDAPGFCYIICDITSTIKERCEILDLRITHDKMGYFGYHKVYNSYIEVISFDKLVKSANERNKSFFDKLGLSS